MKKRLFLLGLILCLCIIPNLVSANAQWTNGCAIWKNGYPPYANITVNSNLSNVISQDGYRGIGNILFWGDGCLSPSPALSEIYGYYCDDITGLVNCTDGRNPVGGNKFAGWYHAAGWGTQMNLEYVDYPSPSNAGKYFVFKISANGGTKTPIFGISYNNQISSTNRDLTVTVKNLANQVIPNVNTAIFINDGSYSNVTITNASGIAVFTNVPVPANSSTELTTAATGIYSAYNEDFNFDSSPMSKTIYLQPVSPSGTYSNFTYHVTDTSGTVLENAYIDHRINNNYELIDLTDSNGDKTFYSVPVVNNAWYYTVYKSGFVDNSMFSSFTAPFPSDVTINVTLQGGGNIPPVTPTPTITPPIGLSWTLTANPNSILLGDDSLLWLNAPNIVEYNKARSIMYYENTNLGGFTNFVLLGTYKYNLTTSLWNFRDKNGVWNYTAHDPTGGMIVTPQTTGTYTYKATIFDNGTFPYTTGNVIGTAQTNLVIGGGAGGNENLVCIIAANDGKTGMHLSDWGLTLTDTITGASNHWDNISYDKSVSLVRGREYTITGSKFGYIDSTKTITPPLDQNVQTGDLGAIFSVELFKSGDLVAGNTTVIVTAIDMETYQNMPNALIQVTGVESKYTGENGEPASFVLPYNTEYTATATKTNYCGASTFRDTGTDDYQYVYVYVKYGACQGVTPTHTPVPNQTTVRPTPTLIGGYGNLTGKEAGVCNALPVNATIVDQIKSQMACVGVTDLLTQNLIFACMLILGAGMIAASKAKGVGFGIGASIGAVISMGIGLIPFWIVVVLVLLAVAVIAAKGFFFSGG